MAYGRTGERAKEAIGGRLQAGGEKRKGEEGKRQSKVRCVSRAERWAVYRYVAHQKPNVMVARMAIPIPAAISSMVVIVSPVVG
jgi:hypothetical protein